MPLIGKGDFMSEQEKEQYSDISELETNESSVAVMEREESAAVDVAQEEIQFQEDVSEGKKESGDSALSEAAEVKSLSRSDDKEKGENVCRSYSPLIVCYHKPESGIAEEYRTLRTALLSKITEDKFCYVVTSSADGEGKTLTCLNLGFVLSEYRHKKVVIVDCNFRGSGVSKFLGISSRVKGFAELVASSASLDEVVWGTRRSNLYIIPSGNMIGASAPEIFGDENIEGVIGRLREEYDFVLLDVPAVTRFSDASVLGQIVGGVLFVVKMHGTPKKIVGEGVGLLKSLGVEIQGVVLTNHRRESLGIVGRFF